MVSARKFSFLLSSLIKNLETFDLSFIDLFCVVGSGALSFGCLLNKGHYPGKC